jgi:hypothetical protein
MVTEPLRFRACDVSRGEASSGNCFQRTGEYGAPLDAIAYICAGKGCDVELLCTSAVSLRCGLMLGRLAYVDDEIVDCL